jgi:hypothetical protein
MEDGAGNKVDHVIGSRNGSNVGRVVRVVRGVKDQGAGPGVLLVPVDRNLDLAILHQQHLFPGMTMWRVRRHSRVERRDVHLKLLKRPGGIIKHRPELADAGGLWRKRVPVNRGGRKHRRLLGRGVGVDGGRLGSGGQG